MKYEKLNADAKALVDRLVSERVESERGTPITSDPDRTVGFKSMGEFAKTVALRPHDPRLKRGLVEGEDSLGGYLVPTQFIDELLTYAKEDEIIRPRAKVYTMTGDKLYVPGLKREDRSSGNTVYGITEQWASWSDSEDEWPSEGVTMTETDPTFRAIQLEARKLYCYCRVSNELLMDAMGVETIIGDLFASSLAYFMDLRFLTGSGVGQPQGILNSPALLALPRATASQVAWADIILMWERLMPGCHGNAIWIAGNDLIQQIYNVTAPTSNAGMWDELYRAKGIQTLFGRPIFFTDKNPSIGSQGDLMLVDPKFYSIGMRNSMALEASSHERFRQYQTSFRMVLRLDGQTIPEGTTTLRNGMEVSPFVCLDA